MKPLDDELDPDRSRRHANARAYITNAEAREGQARMMDEWLATEAGQRWLGTWKEEE